jgi:hypothetical protein
MVVLGLLILVVVVVVATAVNPLAKEKVATEVPA